MDSGNKVSRIFIISWGSNRKGNTERYNNDNFISSIQSADDEGFESLETSSESSLTSEQSTQENIDVWSAALTLPPQKFYTWEMEGK